MGEKHGALSQVWVVVNFCGRIHSSKLVPNALISLLFGLYDLI
jgi:hypothetical protein